MIENELREAFSRHEHLVPDQGPLRQAIDVETGQRRRRRTIGRSVGAALAVAAVLAVPAFLDRDVRDASAPVDVAASVPPAPTPVAAAQPLNVLLIGTDRSRADTMLIAHVPAARDAVYLVSLPRDGDVAIPQHGDGTLSSAFATGGADLTSRTVRDLTGVTLDGTVTVDYAAVEAVTDQVGGVRVCLDQELTSAQTGRRFAAGCSGLDGEAATDLLRQRRDQPDGGPSRDRDGRRLMAALAEKAADAGMTSLLEVVGTGVGLDRNGLALLAEAGSIELGGEPVVGIGAPRYSAVRAGDGTVRERVYPGTADGLFAALADDSLAAWTAAHPDHVTD
jgi:LCP family protein required for cell wall assembly